MKIKVECRSICNYLIEKIFCCQEVDQDSDTSKEQLHRRVDELEKVICNVKLEMRNMIDKDCVSCDNLKSISEKLENTILEEKDVFSLQEKTCADANLQTDFIDSFEEKVTKLEKENKELSAKCSELENCVELLRNEYEKCEDYWQNKVDEERQMFELEQKVNSEKLADLILKMREYEEQYANQDIVDSRLPTIEETYNLEKQFTDLEQEFEDFKIQSENELFKKDEEIALLKEKLTELALRQSECHEVAVQVDSESEEERMLNKMKNFSSYVIENTSRYSEEMLPPAQPNPLSPTSNNTEFTQSLVWQQQTSPPPSTDNPINSSSLPLSWNFSNNTNAPSTSSSSSCLEKNSTPCRPKRTRKHDKNLYKKNNQDKDIKKTEQIVGQPQSVQNVKNNVEQTISLPISSFHNLNGRRNYLEQRVRQLQMCIKQQHYCNEQTLQREYTFTFICS